MTTWTQTWYQNPDLSIAYTIADEESNIVGSGGEVHDDAVLLETDEDVERARAQLDAAQAAHALASEAAMKVASDQAKAISAARAVFAKSAWDKLQKPTRIPFTSGEASELTGYYPPTT